MADERLRQFYAKAGNVLPIIYRWRNALSGRDQKLAGVVGDEFIAEMRSWEALLQAQRDYAASDDEWNIAFGVWNHSGRNGPEPARPAWPAEIPEYFDAIFTVELFGLLLTVAKDPFDKVYHDSQYNVAHWLKSLVNCLDGLLRIIESPEDDGPVDRNKLAEMLGIQPKMLSNRASDLPNPISRDAKGTPIYMYREVRLALIKMYPEKEFMLPAYSEIK